MKKKRQKPLKAHDAAPHVAGVPDEAGASESIEDYYWSKGAEAGRCETMRQAAAGAINRMRKHGAKYRGTMRVLYSTTVQLVEFLNDVAREQPGILAHVTPRAEFWPALLDVNANVACPGKRDEARRLIQCNLQLGKELPWDHNPLGRSRLHYAIKAFFFGDGIRYVATKVVHELPATFDRKRDVRKDGRLKTTVKLKPVRKRGECRVRYSPKLERDRKTGHLHDPQALKTVEDYTDAFMRWLVALSLADSSADPDARPLLEHIVGHLPYAFGKEGGFRTARVRQDVRAAVKGVIRAAD